MNREQTMRFIESELKAEIGHVSGATVHVKCFVHDSPEIEGLCIRVAMWKELPSEWSARQRCDHLDQHPYDEILWRFRISEQDAARLGPDGIREKFLKRWAPYFRQAWDEREQRFKEAS